MEPTYVLWHTQRQGWVSATGTSTVFAEATRFSGADAYKRVKAAVSYDGVPGVVPVHVEEMEKVLA